MKRRTFLRTVGGAAGAAALTGCKTQGLKSSNTTPRKESEPKVPQRATGTFTKKHGQHKTYGIAAKKPSPHPNIFRLSRRMPGWFPDAADPQDDEDYLFPEEVIKHDGDNPFAFTLPTIGEPTARQILGLPTPTKAKTKHKFTFLVRELADKVRMYNITLYELRRFHYCRKFETKGKDKPPPNQHGKQPDLPDWDAPTFNSDAQAAEGKWKKAAKALDDFIDSGAATGHGMPLVAVDMVHVNNYIISMRVVALQSTSHVESKTNILEIGGSSSSHVSISSAFSSPGS